MPFKLLPPQKGRSKVYRVRGTYRGVYLDRSTETPVKSKAEQFRKAWERQVDTGELSGKPELTFAGASLSYLRAGGEATFLKKVTDYFGKDMLARNVDQSAVDECAVTIYPQATAATRKRQVYTPIIAVLRHIKIEPMISHPKGASDGARNCYLTPEQFWQVQTEAAKINQELGILFVICAYTGLRLSEAMSIDCANIDFSRQVIFVGHTKNGQPRAVFTPKPVIAAVSSHPKGIHRHGRLLGLTMLGGGKFYVSAHLAYERAGVDHHGAPFHILRHSFGTWMARAGADLGKTNIWASDAHRRYNHMTWSEEAGKAELLSGEIRAKEA